MKKFYFLLLVMFLAGAAGLLLPFWSVIALGIVGSVLTVVVSPAWRRSS